MINPFYKVASDIIGGTEPTFDNIEYPLGEILYQNDTFDNLEALNKDYNYI